MEATRAQLGGHRAGRRAAILLLAAGCVAVAASSLLAPWMPVYDPWAWLIWGRELPHLELDTSGGPSWKPLPALVGALGAWWGDAGAALWLVVARAGWLLATLLAGLVTMRLASSAGLGRRASIGAAVLAAAGLVLLHDSFTPWLRQFAGGLSEPLLVAFVLASVERAMAGRERSALLLAVGAALLRPEAWPLLAAYGIWLWLRRPGLRVAVALAAGALAVAWFLPDAIGSGSPLTGAERARGGTGPPLGEGLEAVGRVAVMPLAVLWAGAAIALWDAARRGDRLPQILAAGAAAWIVVVALTAGAGWAGLPRFAAPAAAIVCVLGAVGLARLAQAVADGLSWPPRRTSGPLGPAARTPAAVAALVLLGAAGIAQGVPRALALADHAAEASALSESQRDLREVIDRAARGAGAACGPLTVARLEEHSAAAWWLEVPLSELAVSSRRPSRGTYLERRPSGWRARTGRCAPAAATRGVSVP